MPINNIILREIMFINKNPGTSCKIAPKDRMILHANRLLGAPRLRLLRVRNDSCLVPRSFQNNIKVSIISLNVLLLKGAIILLKFLLFTNHLNLSFDSGMLRQLCRRY